MIVEAVVVVVVVVNVDVVRDGGRGQGCGHDGHVEMNINPKKIIQNKTSRECTVQQCL